MVQEEMLKLAVTFTSISKTCVRAQDRALPWGWSSQHGGPHVQQLFWGTSHRLSPQ